MHGNRALITDVLKGRLGFDGLVVSDWNAIEQVDGCTKAHCPQAVNAGIDLFMVPDDWKAFIDNTVADVEGGAVPMSRIDDAVTRIIRVKMRSWLFEQSLVPAADRSGAIASDDGEALAREAVAKSLVLLKNRRPGLFPLPRDARILLVGRGADSVVAQLGGWSLTWQGDQTGDEDFPQADDMLSALRKAVSAGGRVDFSLDATGVDPRRYDVVIAVLSETPYAEMKGDIRLPATLRHSDRYPQDLAVLKAVSGKGVPVVSILYSGRPVYASDLINRSDAFIAAWLPGTEAAGIADVLFGDRDFTGRLPFDWPGAACPETAAEPALFERGYGLRATEAAKLRKLPVDKVASCPML